MSVNLKNKANEIIEILNDLSDVKHCTVYGSLSANTYDELSDIDIDIDVSGSDNGQFMLKLVERLQDKIKIYYYDYAPSLIPDSYIVSIALDNNNPFLVADLKCSANPHCVTVSKQQVKELSNEFMHILKLWTANLKHYARGIDCYDDIARMAEKLHISDIDTKDRATLLENTLCWLENNASNEFGTFITSCRNKFNELI